MPFPVNNAVYVGNAMQNDARTHALVSCTNDARTHALASCTAYAVDIVQHNANPRPLQVQPLARTYALASCTAHAVATMNVEART